MFQSGGSNDAAGANEGSEKKAQRASVTVDETLRAGAKLAQARTAQGLSLDELAERMRVRRDYLEAVEAMNVKALPGRAYALAYIRDYAKALRLDPAAIIAQFKQESALAREDALPQLRNPESKPRRERPWLAAVAIALIAAGFIGWQAWRDRPQDPRLDTAAASAAPKAAAGEAAPPPAAAPAAVVEIAALTESWLEVRGPDGTIFLSRVLQPGDRYRPDVGAGWTVHARDGGAFEVTVDGRPVGKLGEAGAPVLGRHIDALAALKPAPAPEAPPAVKPQG